MEWDKIYKENSLADACLSLREVKNIVRVNSPHLKMHNTASKTEKCQALKIVIADFTAQNWAAFVIA